MNKNKNPMTEEQKQNLKNLKNEASRKIDQGASIIGSNLLNSFQGKNINGEKLKDTLNNIDQEGIFNVIKLVLSEMIDYFMENLPDFAIKIGIMIIAVIVYFSLGGGMLYICKISQTNFLPVFSDCFPYSDKDVGLKDITTNIFTQTLNDDKVSMNLKFKFEDNNKNVLLDAIRKYKSSNKANILLVYLLSIVNALFSFNYNFINTVFSHLNGLNDLIVIILSPIIYILSFIFLFFSNNIYFGFLWFYNMSWFFKKNKNCGKKQKNAKWVPVEMLYNPTEFFIGCILTIFACAFSIGVFISLFINPFFSLPTITMVYSMISSMIFKGEIKDKPINIFTIIMYVFKYYKLPMFLMLSLFTIFRSNISGRLFKIYEEYNKKKTSIIERVGTNLMKINKDINKMNDLSNKMDIMNIRDRVDVIGIDQTLDESTRKLQNQINTANRQNRKITNTQNKIADKLEDAYNVNTPFTIVILCILFAIFSTVGLFKIKDYTMFSPIVDFETNDLECDGEDGDEDGDHTAIYKTYMMGRSLWNAYQQTLQEKQESVNDVNDPLKMTQVEGLREVKKESLDKYESAVGNNPSDSGTPDSGTPDSGAPDSGTPDSGTSDSGTPDSGTSDSGTPDSGKPDSGKPDSGKPDATKGKPAASKGKPKKK